MKNPIQAIKDKVAKTLFGKAWKAFDEKMMVDYPKGWTRTKVILLGWKTLTGYLLYEGPTIMLWANDVLPGILPAFGITDAAPYIQAVGVVLMYAGLIHKGLKWLTLPSDQFDDQD